MANVHSPLDQFLVKPLIDLSLGGIDISFTNSASFIVLTTIVIMLLQYFAVSSDPLKPNKISVLFEILYDFSAGLVIENAGKKARTFAPLIFSLFMFVLCANLFGMLPYSFTITSQFAITATLALFIFLGITCIGFYIHGLKYLRIFYPNGIPLWIAPLLVPMEILSYLIRPITLSVRLFLNVTAGHMLLKVFAGFVLLVGSTWAFAPILFNVAFIGFEFCIAILQAYIFTILTCIYLNDALNLH